MGFFLTAGFLGMMYYFIPWLLIALGTGGAWIMYFNGAPTVVPEFFTGQVSAATLIAAIAMSTSSLVVIVNALRLNRGSA